MEHLEPDPEHFAYWEPTSKIGPAFRMIGGPEEGMDVTPCPTLISVEDVDGEDVVRFHIPLRLDEVELAHMARGGTLWLTTFGTIPIHRLEVQPPQPNPNARKLRAEDW